MDFEFTDEQQELRESVRSVLDKECPPGLAREVAEGRGSPDQLWATMVRLDWPGLALPPEVGGVGLGAVELAVVVEELGRALAPGPFLATVTQFAPVVREAGTAEQRERWLRPLLAGATGALALAEEAGIWSAQAARTSARRDGDGWVLDGRKRFVLDGASADEIAVAARLDDGIGVFVVPGDAVTATPVSTLDGTTALAAVDLRGVRVGADRALGVPTQSGAALTRGLEEATNAVALSTVGTCQAIFDMTLAYAKDRHQFGVPIGSFQAVKHKLADMFVALERARAVGYFAALTIAEDDPRRSLAVSMAKAAAGDCQRLIVQEGLQLHGGIGYTWEHDLHLYLKRAQAGDALFGAAGFHRAAVAEMIGL